MTGGSSCTPILAEFAKSFQAFVSTIRGRPLYKLYVVQQILFLYLRGPLNAEVRDFLGSSSDVFFGIEPAGIQKLFGFLYGLAVGFKSLCKRAFNKRSVIDLQRDFRVIIWGRIVVVQLPGGSFVEEVRNLICVYFFYHRTETQEAFQTIGIVA